MCSNTGTQKRPTVDAQAIDESVMAEKPPQPRTEAAATPPGRRVSQNFGVVDTSGDARAVGDVTERHGERDHAEVVGVDEVEGVREHRRRGDAATRRGSEAARQRGGEGGHRGDGGRREGDGDAQRQQDEHPGGGEETDGGGLDHRAAPRADRTSLARASIGPPTPEPFRARWGAVRFRGRGGGASSGAGVRLGSEPGRRGRLGPRTRCVVPRASGHRGRGPARRLSQRFGRRPRPAR